MCVKYAPVTGIAEGIVMTLNDEGDHYWFRWLVDPKCFRWNRSKISNSRKLPSGSFKWLLEHLLRNSSKFWISFNGWLIIIACEDFKSLNELLFSKSNSHKRQSLCSFSKSEVWKQNLNISRDTHMEFIVRKNEVD